MEIKFYSINEDGNSVNTYIENPKSNYDLFLLFPKMMFTYSEFSNITICWNDNLTSYRQEINENNGSYTKLWIIMDNLFKSANYFSNDFKNG